MSDFNKIPRKPELYITGVSHKKRKFIWRILPHSGDALFEKIRKSSVLVSLSLIVSLGGFVLPNQLEQKDNLDIVIQGQEAREYVINTGKIPDYIPPDVVENIIREKPEILPEFIPAYSENQDLVGHLNVPSTKIDYDIYQTTDNEYYLKHNELGKYDKYGAFFADYKIPYFKDSMGNEDPMKTPDNMIIYGHNYAGNVRSLRPIFDYNPIITDEEEFFTQYNEAPVIQYDTIYKKSKYKIFAAHYVDTDVSDPLTYEYFKARNFPNQDAFYTFVGNIMDRSLFYTDVDVEYGDKILTLSTCCFSPFKKATVNGRFVVFAREIREGESEYVDTKKMYINPDPLMFSFWYKYYDTTWGGRNWDTSKVIGFDRWISENGDFEYTKIFNEDGIIEQA